MKIIVFDVNNAACSIVVCPNGYGLMIDCGCHSEKLCPVYQINHTYKDWLKMKPFITANGISYKLSLLHITHPDDDHVKNARVLVEQLTPYLLRKRDWEVFPENENIHEEYKELIDKKYRGENPETIPWCFSQNKIFQIPMDIICKAEELSQKVKNNSSILRYLEYEGIKVLFGGDLEKAGWSWLANHNEDFAKTMKNGIDILIAPHHGHKSGFPEALFELTGNVKIAVLSKSSESEKEDSDVSSQYSSKTEGISYKNLEDKQFYFASGTLTTRSNGNIFFEVESNGNINAYAEKASSNHRKL